MDYKEYHYNLSLEEESTASRTMKLVGYGKRVLELGCSVGAQSKILVEQLGCSVVGVEINPNAAEKARNFCDKVLVGNLDKFDLGVELAGEQFDVVLCADVLEHLYSPTELIRKLKPILANDGYIVSSIPNIAHAALIFELANGKFDYRSRGLLDDTHIRFFTRKSLFSMFTDAGYLITHLDRGLAEPLETEFSVTTDFVKDRLFLDYIQTQNVEAHTYHFIVRANQSNLALDELRCINLDFEVRNLEIFKNEQHKIIEKSMCRLDEYYISYPKAYSDLQWLQNTRLFKARMILSYFARRLINKNR